MFYKKNENLTSSSWSPFQKLAVVPTGPWGRMDLI